MIPDLVVLDPSDPALKAVASPVLAREVEESSPTSRLALETGRALLEAGYHQQVPVRDGFLNLFVLAERERRAVGLDGDDIEIRGTGTRLAKADAVRSIETEPGPWSPNALLRPVTQDVMLPTDVFAPGLFAQQVAIVERTLVPLVQTTTRHLTDGESLVRELMRLIVQLREIDARTRPPRGA